MLKLPVSTVIPIGFLRHVGHGTVVELEEVFVWGSFTEMIPRDVGAVLD